MDCIELKKTRLDDGTAPTTSRVCSSPATSSLSPRNPATPQGTVPRRPIAYSGSSSVAGVNHGSMSPSDVSLGKGQERMVRKAILQGASSNSALDKQKKWKSNQLDQFMPALSSICPVCFILGWEMVPSHPVGDQAESGHRPFYHCPFYQLLDHRGSTPGPTFAGFVDFRNMICLRKGFYYCYMCWMPQSKNGNGPKPVRATS
jgi:hypothetical protein